MSSIPDLIIPMSFDGVSKLSFIQGASKTFYAKDLPWRVMVRTYKDCKDIVLFLFCNFDDTYMTAWSCDLSIDTVIINSHGDDKVLKNRYKFEYNKLPPCKQIIDWNELSDPEKGFMKDDRLVIETRLYIKKTSGVRKLNLIDFTKPVKGQNIVILEVEGKKLHLSRDFLSIHSPVFAAMFTKGLDEQKKKGITLNDVKYEEFVDLLNVIYPTLIEINRQTFRHILDLADQFNVECALYRVESYLMKSEKYSFLSKMVFADQYGLDALLDHTLDLCTDIETIKDLKPAAEYDNFSDKTKAAICDRMMDLCTCGDQK
ncbi:hypothetical protein PFISCL1PPCAC_24514 [Pristionchus fissidentatus]|uniref:BTB domain-containing protein n=1 Tax=Pristionchus fissidentatus TaxID=1538716 RepID=A0AAV5WMJ7_9BILA|nr:hypothetical protein PFISCL1PPCAC_24514 [Pristionchus fissidentatus]